MNVPLSRRLAAEFLGSGFLVAAVVGSGIMGERLAGGNVAIALLANTIATGAALFVLILSFGPISRAHMNPAVTFADALEGGIAWKDVAPYIAAQCAGAVGGTVLAHAMFSLPLIALSHHTRSGAGQVLSEFVATFGLLSVIWGCSRAHPGTVPLAVGAYIASAYWFTASTSFANPAVTIARSLSDTFAGIQPSDVLPFVLAQAAGATVATLLFRWLLPQKRRQKQSLPVSAIS
jgi:glycerol uptake facilitator-like aquaporin